MDMFRMLMKQPRPYSFNLSGGVTAKGDSPELDRSLFSHFLLSPLAFLKYLSFAELLHLMLMLSDSGRSFLKLSRMTLRLISTSAVVKPYIMVRTIDNASKISKSNANSIQSTPVQNGTPSSKPGGTSQPKVQNQSIRRMTPSTRTITNPMQNGLKSASSCSNLRIPYSGASLSGKAPMNEELIDSSQKALDLARDSEIEAVTIPDATLAGIVESRLKLGQVALQIQQLQEDVASIKASLSSITTQINKYFPPEITRLTNNISKLNSRFCEIDTVNLEIRMMQQRLKRLEGNPQQMCDLPAVEGRGHDLSATPSSLSELALRRSTPVSQLTPPAHNHASAIASPGNNLSDVPMDESSACRRERQSPEPQNIARSPMASLAVETNQSTSCQPAGIREGDKSLESTAAIKSPRLALIPTPSGTIISSPPPSVAEASREPPPLLLEEGNWVSVQHEELERIAFDDPKAASSTQADESQHSTPLTMAVAVTTEILVPSSIPTKVSTSFISQDPVPEVQIFETQHEHHQQRVGFLIRRSPPPSDTPERPRVLEPAGTEPRKRRKLIHPKDNDSIPSSRTLTFNFNRSQSEIENHSRSPTHASSDQVVLMDGPIVKRPRKVIDYSLMIRKRKKIDRARDPEGYLLRPDGTRDRRSFKAMTFNELPSLENEEKRDQRNEAVA